MTKWSLPYYFVYRPYILYTVEGYAVDSFSAAERQLLLQTTYPYPGEEEGEPLVTEEPPAHLGRPNRGNELWMLPSTTLDQIYQAVGRPTIWTPSLHA